VENVGSCPLAFAGREVQHAEVAVGETIWLQNEVLFICVRRPRRSRASLAALKLPVHDFGRADALGLVGESAAVWEIRERVTAAASQPFHVLVIGESGTGKEIVARAIHELSARRVRTLISRNAATIPESLADAELFGNARGYPQAGMPERPGLIGAAHESSLFLDEIGELPHALQARLLRVLDEGDYQRLGEAQSRRSELRLIAATNRAPGELKHDMLARLAVRIAVPDLNARREDIPLLVAHLLRRQAAREPSIAARFFAAGDPDGAPRVSPCFLEQLLQHDYKTNVRELGSMLAMATLDCNGTYLESSELLAFDRRLSALTLPPASSAAKAWWLSVEENLRLELLRKHRFSPTSCGRDSAYRGNRQTADLHLRHLICKALDAGNWDAQAAARLLAGEDETLVEKCQSRVQTFLSNLEERVSKMPADELDRALADDWKGLLDAVLPVIVRLRAQRRVSEASPDNAPH
jgi:DNA-binding NtrC family response regulator